VLPETVARVNGDAITKAEFEGAVHEVPYLTCWTAPSAAARCE
jgi:hypothetical protein